MVLFTNNDWFRYIHSPLAICVTSFIKTPKLENNILFFPYSNDSLLLNKPPRCATDFKINCVTLKCCHLMLLTIEFKVCAVNKWCIFVEVVINDFSTVNSGFGSMCSKIAMDIISAKEAITLGLDHFIGTAYWSFPQISIFCCWFATPGPNQINEGQINEWLNLFSVVPFYQQQHISFSIQHGIFYTLPPPSPVSICFPWRRHTQTGITGNLALDQHGNGYRDLSMDDNVIFRKYSLNFV